MPVSSVQSKASHAPQPGGAKGTTSNQNTSCISTCQSYTVTPVMGCCSSFFEKVAEYAIWIKDLILWPFQALYDKLFGEAEVNVGNTSFIVFTPEISKNKNWAYNAELLSERLKYLFKSPSLDERWKEVLMGWNSNPKHYLWAFLEKNFIAYLKQGGVTNEKEIQSRLKGLYSRANRPYFELIIQVFKQQKLIK